MNYIIDCWIFILGEKIDSHDLERWNKVGAKILEIQGQIESLTEGRDSKKYRLARSQLTISYDHCKVVCP